MSNIAHPGVELEDNVIAYVHYKNGAQGIVQASTALWPGTDIRIEINGTNGTAIMVGEKVETWKFRDEKPKDEEIRSYGSAAQATGAGGAADFGYYDHMVVVQDLVDAVSKNREVIIPVTSVRNTVELMLAMYQSDAYNKPVEFPVKDDESIWDVKVK